jgi:hypothetical protein
MNILPDVGAFNASTADIEQQTADVVVARFDEDLTWLQDCADTCKSSLRIHVYNKGAALVPTGLFASVCQLPNVGREGHTYLHHIICNYDKLGDITVFVQGRIDDHISQHPTKALRDMIHDTAQYGYWHPAYAIAVPYGFRHTTYFGKQLLPATCEFGQWFCKYISNDFPDQQVFPFYKNGIFAVSRRYIRSRSVTYYKNLLSQLLHEDPETGHYLERCWAYIFQLPCIYSTTNTGGG